MQRARSILVVVLLAVTYGCANVRSMQDGWFGKEPAPAPHHRATGRPAPVRHETTPASAAPAPAAATEDASAARDEEEVPPTAAPPSPPPEEAKPPAEPALYDPF